MGPADVTAALLEPRDPGNDPVKAERVALLGDPFSYQKHRIQVGTGLRTGPGIWCGVPKPLLAYAPCLLAGILQVWYAV